MEQKWVEISPDLAQEWLRANTNNRVLRPLWINQLAGAIERDEWRPNTDAIGFTISGKLSNGQHRLKAVIKAGKPALMLVIRGLPEDTIDVLDQGLKRSKADTLYLYGIENSKGVVAAYTFYYKYGEGRANTGSYASPTTTQIKDFIF